MQSVVIEHDFPQPPAEVFAYLSEHENLEDPLEAKIKRISNGTDGRRNGVGSVRSIRVAPLVPSFEETNTEVRENELLRYRITKGSPLREHRGEMTFAPKGDGTHFTWTITFRSAIPGLDRVIAAALGRGIPRGLEKAEANMSGVKD